MADASLAAALAEVQAAKGDDDAMEAALRSVAAVLTPVPAFLPMADGSAACPRMLNEAFVSLLDQAVPPLRSAVANFQRSNDVVEAAAAKFANTAASRYEHPAAAAWPAYEERCPGLTGLTASFRLEPSGLVTYTLAANTDQVQWELHGEGVWQVLLEGASVTEVDLQLRQGLEGTSVPHTGEVNSIREPPRTVRVDLRSCSRVLLEGYQWEDDDDDDGDDEEEAEDGN
eukprot:gnl/TRDRNA2_/TRDRNA2_60838_c0_seq1.p2 gnl/TRDRNA2_/TRDRNA2_60838_c0~~gnl/TRDRNA2_/TRDRNA2_60838_c0_seq1.p2  ORF type:complete len:229 (+),score=62.44 gnl/TRDRNA2_/TRDRNA2_60838_c0_seq1:78-764(+)